MIEGNTVDIEAANWTNTIGASELATVWTDPDFDPWLGASHCHLLRKHIGALFV